MAANALSLSQRRELASRTSDDLEVTLWWDPRVDALAVSVWDWRSDTHFELAVDRDRARRLLSPVQLPLQPSTR
jgi:hypothetical protein